MIHCYYYGITGVSVLNLEYLYFSLLTLRLPRFFCNTGYQGGGGYHPSGFRVWFQISYIVIQQWIQHSILNRLEYLVVHYVKEPRNYIIKKKNAKQKNGD